MSRLFINASNVHQGGGKNLLDFLVNNKSLGNNRVLLLDSRNSLDNNLSNNDTIKRVKPSVFSRLLAEWWLSKNVNESDTVLCFGNLPPLFKLRGHVVVFIQNRYLLENVSLSNCTWSESIRLRIERFWVRIKIANANKFIVQTPSMKKLLISLLEDEVKKYAFKSKHEYFRPIIKVLPLMESIDNYHRHSTQFEYDSSKDFDFVYVASGTHYKNHRRLIEAWCLLAKEGIFPSLFLTIDRSEFSELTNWIDKLIDEYKLNVENFGIFPHNEIRELYGRVSALIYPSTFESFGLPLIEARQAGLSIVASELDYIRDILDPEQTFNPESAESISRAVKRFLGIQEIPLTLHNSESFMSHIIEK
jgi:glycosyltransferase involved in cell wall biosynthesis